ncbi:hypothetical protein BRADI_1g49160v3 [Brachypodium distachyon]|uniref:Sugar phosphate transporter domain-containing protein n=1 Tax=Brachypodium distachyon TaxID=15368 RepID=A0A2K2DQG7_BRADI|nr:hypothetical protein BRADI_1g49160v3 [Brachypodium distachyon]PNT76525.1 hypothetical protein BRADI_1g49160v3 [Brachypodium distachyon]
MPEADADGAVEVVSPRSGYFRQRSMHAPATDPDRKAFDVENPPGTTAAASAAAGGGGGGLRPSESVAKLESLERAERAALAPAVVLKTGFYILVWYTFSTCLTLYNKTLLGDKLGKFPAPLLMNTVHFALQAALSKIIMLFQAKGLDAAVDMGWKDYLMRVVPTALGTALDINLSNASLVFISVTFATMCKSASPIFLLLFAFTFRLESPSIKLMGIIVVISIGVLLTVAKETDFDFWGFIFVTLAAVMSGFRWSMTQILLQKDSYGLKDPITLMSHVTPVMAIATMVLSLLLDPWSDFRKNAYFDNPWHVMRSFLLMLIGGSLAFFMVAVFYFHDEFTWLKGFGLITIMVGVSLFNWYKYEKFKKGHINEDEVSSSSFNGDAKYIILDDLEYQDEFQDEDT